MNVDDIVRIRIAEAAQKIAAARKRREQQQAARDHGLAQRHAQKLRHLAARSVGEVDGTPDHQNAAPDDGCSPRAGVREACGDPFQAASGDAPEMA